MIRKVKPVVFLFFTTYILMGCGSMATPVAPTYPPAPTYTPFPIFPSEATATPDLAVSTQALPTITPQIYLVSASYMADDWDPRVIDLLTVAEHGIPVYPGSSLRFFNLWISVPKEGDQYFVGTEVYGGGDLIGTSGFQQVDRGLVKINEIQITENYLHPVVKDAWTRRDNWDKLDIYIYLYPDDAPGVNSISLSHTTIPFNNEGASWYIAPPYAHLVGIEYSRNGGQPERMDFTQILSSGLPVTQGDQISLTKVWYKSDTDAYGHTLEFEAYLTSSGYSSERLKIVWFPFEKNGVYEIPDLSDFSWVILESENFMVITLSRDDETVLDRYVIPFRK
jgi:hypothetical protein